MEYNRKQKSLSPIDILKFGTVNTGTTFKQYDINTSILELELVANGEPVHLKDEKVYVTVKSSSNSSTQLISKYSGISTKEKDNYKILLRAKKSRRRDVNNIIDVYISPLALENSGEMIAEVMIIDLIKEERVTSQSFTFNIEPSITPNRPSESAYKIVKDLDGTYITDAEDVQLLVAEVEPNFKLSFVGTRVNEILEKANNFDIEDNTNKIQSLQEKDVELESKISNLEQKDSSLDGEIASLKSSNQSIEEEIQGLKTKDESIESEISQLKSKDTLIDGEIDKLKNADETIKSDINSKYEELKQKTDLTNNEIVRLKAQDTTLSESIRTNRSLIDVINPKVATLEQDSQNVKNRVSVLEGDMNLAKSNISTLQRSNTELSQKVEGVEQGNASINEILEQLQRDVESYKSSIELLESKVPVWKDFKGESFKVENSFYGKSRDLSIKGKTLQNLLPLSGNYNIMGSVTSSNVKNFKLNTEYTMIVRIKNSKNPKNLRGLLGRFYRASNTTAITVLDNQIIKDGEYKAKFTIDESIKSFEGLWGRTQEQAGDIVCDYEYLFLEGDWTNKSTPSYFEGIKSLGEQEGNKVSILSNGRNLCPINTFNAERERMVITKVPLILKPNTNYFVSSSHQIACLLSNTYVDNIDHHDTLYSTVVSHDKGTEIGTSLSGEAQFNSSNFKYCYITTWIHIPAKTLIKNIMLEEGIRKSAFQPYKQYKKDISLQEPLRSVGDLCDFISGEGNPKEIRYIRQHTLTGNEDMTLSTTQPNSELYLRVWIKEFADIKEFSNIKIMCNNFPSKRMGNIPNEEGIEVSNGIDIQILKSKLSSPDLEGFRDWLKKNSTIIVYQLKSPIITPLNEDINFGALDDITYVSLENNIKSELSCQCQVSLASSKA